jgi:hypothetical protein
MCPAYITYLGDCALQVTAAKIIAERYSLVFPYLKILAVKC